MQKSNKENRKSGIRRKTSVGTKRNSSNLSAKKGRVNTKSSGISSPNDPTWYNLDPVVTKDAASVPFGYPIGAPVHLGTNWNASRTHYPRVPGVCAVEVAPTIGNVSEPTDPINMAASQIYAFTTHANSRNTTYDAGDMMLYLLAMSEIYSYIGFCKRLYGIARMYTYDNKYYPETLFEAMNVETDIHKNLADFRFRLNTLIGKAATFAVPNTMSFFLRREWMYTGVYADSDNPRDQVYLFVPHGFYAYNFSESAMNYYEWKTMYREFMGESQVLLNGDQVLDILERMINLVFNNTDLGTMNGDIQKAYGENVHKLSYIGEDYVTVPTCEPTVLEQIRNATVVPTLAFNSLDITSGYTHGQSVLISKPKFLEPGADWNDIATLASDISDAAGIYHMFTKPMLFTNLEQPDPAFVLDISRLTACFSHGDETQEPTIICGTEMVTAIYLSLEPGTLFSVNFNVSNDSAASVAGDRLTEVRAALLANLAGQGREEMLARSFKYIPRFSAYPFADIYAKRNILASLKQVSSTNGPDITSYPTNNFSVVDVHDLNNMHQAAIYNQFYVPRVGF